jgi:hypothetical protein
MSPFPVSSCFRLAWLTAAAPQLPSPLAVVPGPALAPRNASCLGSASLPSDRAPDSGPWGLAGPLAPGWVPRTNSATKNPSVPSSNGSAHIANNAVISVVGAQIFFPYTKQTG